MTLVSDCVSLEPEGDGDTVMDGGSDEKRWILSSIDVWCVLGTTNAIVVAD